MDAKKKESVKRMFEILKLCSVSIKQEELLESFEEQFNERGTLSDRQLNILMDIYERAESK